MAGARSPCRAPGGWAGLGRVPTRRIHPQLKPVHLPPAIVLSANQRVTHRHPNRRSFVSEAVGERAFQNAQVPRSQPIGPAFTRQYPVRATVQRLPSPLVRQLLLCTNSPDPSGLITRPVLSAARFLNSPMSLSSPESRGRTSPAAAQDPPQRPKTPQRPRPRNRSRPAAPRSDHAR